MFPSYSPKHSGTSKSLDYLIINVLRKNWLIILVKFTDRKEWRLALLVECGQSSPGLAKFYGNYRARLQDTNVLKDFENSLK